MAEYTPIVLINYVRKALPSGDTIPPDAITGLVDELANKSDEGHTHSKAEIEAVLTGSITSHTHPGGGGGVDTANSPNANEFARFTDADTIEGRTVAEVKTDLGLDAAYEAKNTNIQAHVGSAHAPSNATANDTDANLKARANHTGTQPMSTISDAGTLATQNGTFSGSSSGTNTGDQDLSGKQNTLVSGTNIKTINGSTVLGSGDLVVSGAAQDIATTQLVPTISETIATNTAGVTYGSYEITGALSLTVAGTGRFFIA